MDFELPENVQVHKQKQPKGWSYPLQTSEIVTGLGLADLDVRVSIFYMNNVPTVTYPRNQKRHRDFDWFNVFSLTWYGHLAANTEPEPYFHMGIHLCDPKHRPRLHKIVVEEVLFVAAKWMGSIQKAPNINSISLDYRSLKMDPPKHPYPKGLELVENKERRLFAKVIDLNADEEKKDGGSEGTVLQS